MPSFTLRLTEEQSRELKRAASENLISEQDYILSKVFSAQYIDNNRLKVTDIIKKAKKLPPCSEFTLPSLYPIKYWNGISVADRRVISRTFKKLVMDPENTLSEEISYIGKKSNLATYRRN
jgi:hypothetical protein